MNSCHAEFVLQASSVSTFEQSWPKFGVDLHPRRDDSVADLLSGESVDNGGGHRCDLQIKIVSRRAAYRKVIRHKTRKKSKSGTTKDTNQPGISFLYLRVLSG
jgi:hypothetical protein